MQKNGSQPVQRFLKTSDGSKARESTSWNKERTRRWDRQRDVEDMEREEARAEVHLYFLHFYHFCLRT